MRARPIGRGKPIELGLDRVEIVNPGHDGGSPPFRTGKSRRRSRPNGCAPARERDPGEGFPWERLWRGPRRPLDRARAGHWTEPAPLSSGPLFAHEEEGPPVRALQALLALYGYGAVITGVHDRHTRQSSPRSSATSGPSASTTKPTLRRARR